MESLSQQQYKDESTFDAVSESVGLIHGTSTKSSRKSCPRGFKTAIVICAAITLVAAIFTLGYTSGYHASPLTPSPTSVGDAGSVEDHDENIHEHYDEEHHHCGHDDGYHEDKVEGEESEHHHSHDHQCETPYYRREWRSLSKVEKKGYMEAVQCMIDAPSVLGLNGSLIDDFSWAHNRVAKGTHGTSPFLTWHRRFIWVYENYLRHSCGYEGALPFWDWSLDWEDPASSPIFGSHELAFGTDGDPKAPKYGPAHCVTDLPFKNLRPKWYGSHYAPHCLTRWFDNDWYGHYMNPEALEGIMNVTSYAEFVLAVEMGPHDLIPMGIRGDFTGFTAPNDPIFYLHHSQLDRIFWLWQSKDKAERVHDYSGEGPGNTTVSLSDVITLSGLDMDVTVADIMDTERGEMCYRYIY